MGSALAVEPAGETNQAQDEPAVSKQPCVLLAEDDRDMRMLLAAALRQAGYDVVEALDGVDLLDCIAWVVERRSDWTEAVLVTSEDPSELVPLEEVERRYILRVLEALGGNKTLAARTLRLDRKTLYRKLERWGADRT